MKLDYTIKQDDFTRRTVTGRELWRLLKAYLLGGRELIININDPKPDGIKTEITVKLHESQR